MPKYITGLTASLQNSPSHVYSCVGLVNMHCEQGNCVYLDMQGHDRPV